MHLRTTTIRRNDKTYRYAQLVESFRGDDGRPTSRLVAHLGALTDEQVCNLKLALEASRTHRALVLPALEPTARKSPEVLANLAYLDVVVALEMWRHWDLDELLASVLPVHEQEVRPELVVASLVVQRCVDPGSKLYAERWFPRTALPELLGVAPGQFNNTRIHRALDLLEQSTEQLQTGLVRRYATRGPAFTALFLDVTDTWFVGHGPPLAQKGKTKEGLYQRKIGIVLMCNEAGLPLRWELVAGRQNDGEAMLDLLQATRKVCWLGDAPVVMDRALGKTAYLRKLLQLGQRFLTALTEDEFDAYTDRIPHDAVQDLDAFSEQAAQRAKKAVLARGLVEHNDRVLLLDLGVVERREQADSRPASVETAQDDPLRQSLELATRMSKDRQDGKAYNCRQLGAAHGLKKERVAKLLTLLRLAPDLQDLIRSGAAAKLSIAAALRIAQLANPQQQREAFNQQLAHAASTRPRSVQTRRSPVTQAAKDDDLPVRVRAVLCFNPEQFVEQRRAADETLGQVNTFVSNLNRQLQSPKSRCKEQKAYALVHAELKRRHLVDAFSVSVQRNNNGSLNVQVTLCEQQWRQRRRFDGFSILVGHPDIASEPGELDRLYRAKDAVEKDFHVIKSVVQLRPVRHRNEAKIRAHVTLCMLALLLERTLEHKLANAPLTAMTAERCFELLGNVHLNHINHAKAPVYTITRADSEQRAILDKLGLAHLIDDEMITPRITPR